MIDGLQAAIAKINNSIPKEILEVAFGSTDYSQSIDRTILEQVLLPRMRDDISIRGGKILNIALDSTWRKNLDTPYKHGYATYGSHSVYQVPEEFRELRDISCVLRVRRPHIYRRGGMAGATGHPYVGNSLVGLSRAALDAQTGANFMPVPVGDIRPGNIIYLTPAQYTFIPWCITVRLRYDDNFSGMDVSLISPFADLCLTAVQAYIYNKLIVTIDSNMVYRGADLGVVKDTILDYKDANTRYDELLLQFGGTELLTVERFKDFAQYIVGPV